MSLTSAAETEQRLNRLKLEQLRAFRWSEAPQEALLSDPVFKAPLRAGYDFIPVFASGGIGDLFVSMGVVQALYRRTKVPVRLWCPHWELAEFILEHWSPAEGRPKVTVMHEPFPGCDYYIHLNSLGSFHFQRNFKAFQVEAVQELHVRALEFAGQEPWPNLIRYLPYLDNESARQAVSLGLRRRTLPYAMLGLPLPTTTPYRLDIRALPYDYEPFITVHDGFETSQPVQHRATKTWNLRHWASLVETIRREFPGFMVIQLGGPTSREIPGVDVNLVGKTPIEESLAVLSRSVLHIDGDSGLVHAARHMGVQSCVLFGPTPADFFGYEENINLQSEVCGDCWWLNRFWLQRCPIGHPTPVCLDSISPRRVFFSIAPILRGKS